jgi:hypothetical protein
MTLNRLKNYLVELCGFYRTSLDCTARLGSDPEQTDIENALHHRDELIGEIAAAETLLCNADPQWRAVARSAQETKVVYNEIATIICAVQELDDRIERLLRNRMELLRVEIHDSQRQHGAACTYMAQSRMAAAV